MESEIDTQHNNLMKLVITDNERHCKGFTVDRN